PIVTTDEGGWLDGSNCKNKLITGGVKWPMLVWLDLSSSSHSKKQFEDLLKNANALNEELRLKKFDASKDLVWLTVTGILRTHENLAAHQEQGFGHMHAAPAELVVISESDPFIERSGRSKQEKSK